MNLKVFLSNGKYYAVGKKEDIEQAKKEGLFYICNCGCVHFNTPVSINDLEDNCYPLDLEYIEEGK